MDVALHPGRVDLFVFAGNPEASDSDQLVLMLGDLVLRGIFVEVGQGEEEGLFLEVEGLVDVNEPVDEDLAHVGSDANHEFFPFLLLNRAGGTWRVRLNLRMSCSY